MSKYKLYLVIIPNSKIKIYLMAKFNGSTQAKPNVKSSG